MIQQKALLRSCGSVGRPAWLLGIVGFHTESGHATMHCANGMRPFTAVLCCFPSQWGVLSVHAGLISICRRRRAEQAADQGRPAAVRPHPPGG